MTQAALQRLNIDVSQFGVAGQHLPAIRAALARGLPELSPALVAHDGWMVCVGSGPSLPTCIDRIAAERDKGRPVLAVNGAHDFLCEHGIEPDLFLTVDPRDLRHNLRKKNERTTYLLASRCAPEVFDHLKDCKVMLWHSYGKPDEAEAIRATGKRFLIGGGSTSGLRAVAVGFMLGFRNFILAGYDSCNDAHGNKRFDDSKVGVTTDVWVGERQFICNMAMAAQANEFQDATYGWLGKIHLEAWGDGLIAAILAERSKQGKWV